MGASRKKKRVPPSDFERGLQKWSVSPFSVFSVVCGACAVLAAVKFSYSDTVEPTPTKAYSDAELGSIAAAELGSKESGESVYVAAVSLEGNDHRLVRASCSAWQRGGSSVVVKQFAPGKYVPSNARDRNQVRASYRDATLDYEREVAALAALNNSMLHGVPLAPYLFAARDSDGIMVVEDMRPQKPLYVHMGVRMRNKEADAEASIDSPFSTDPIALGYFFPRMAEAFASLHSPRYARAFHERHASTSKAWLLEISREQDYELFLDSAERFVAAAAAARGKQAIPHLDAELDIIASSLREPHPSMLSLTHGDVCVDNIFVSGAKNARAARPRLLDYSSAGLRHSLSDVAAVLLLFPTCWCAGDIPWPFLVRFSEMYRHRAALLAASSEARAAIESDEFYFSELMKMCAFHLIVVVSEYWEDAAR